MRRTIASLTLFALPCAAQGVVPLVPLPQRGMLPAFQAGIVFDHEPHLIRRKLVNLEQTMSTFPAGPNSPAYDAAAALQMLGQSVQLEEPLEIDAMSSGNDLLPASFDPIANTFEIGAGNINGWANLSVVVETDGASATVYSYYFNNPLFPTHLRDAMYHELLREDFLLPRAPLPPSAGIRALDVNMGLIQSANGHVDGTLKTVNRMYFSLTPGSAALVNAALTSLTVPHPWLGRGEINGAAIFVAQYDSAGNLTDVDLHQTASELGLPAALNDIDALGVALMTGPGPLVSGNHRVAGNAFLYVVSFGDGQAPAEELQFIATTMDPASSGPGTRRLAPVRTNSGLRLVGMTPRVKAVCARDPEGVPGGSLTGGHALGVPAIGLPSSLPQFPQSTTQVLSLTAEGAGPGLPNDVFSIYGTLTGNAQQPPTMVAFFILVDGAPAFFMGGFWDPSQGPYEFRKPLDIPWLEDTTRDYAVVMATLDANNQPVFSHRSLLRRKKS